MSSSNIFSPDIKTPTLSPEIQHLNRALSRVSEANLRTGNKVELLLDGAQTYNVWLEKIEKSEKWVHIENYIFLDDGIGQLFAEKLINAAKRGVKVKILYDWIGCFWVKKSFWNKMRAEGIEVRAMSPFTVASPLNIFKRDHRKFIGVDGIYASVGGVCIGDQWLEKSPKTGLPYRDTALSIEGPAIVDLERAFADVWKLVGEPVSIEEYPTDLNFPEIVGDKAVRVIEQQSGKMNILKILELMIAGAERRLWIADAYFIAVPSLYLALINAAKDGVDVRILLPATNDLPILAAISRTGYRALLEAGVKIWEYTGPMMHSKTTVIDGWWSRVGSTNLNASSLYLNWEIDLVVEDREFGQEMESIYEKDLANAREITLEGNIDHKKVKSKTPMSKQDREIQRRYDGSDRFFATAVRVGNAAFRSSNRRLFKHEKRFNFIVSIIILLVAAFTAFFAREVGYLIAVVLIVVGVVKLVGIVRMRG